MGRDGFQTRLYLFLINRFLNKKKACRDDKPFIFIVYTTGALFTTIDVNCSTTKYCLKSFSFDKYINQI